MASGLSQIDIEYDWKPHRVVPGWYFLASQVYNALDTPSFEGATGRSPDFRIKVRDGSLT